MQPNPRLTLLPNNTLQIRAHCKLNLGLRIFPARPDGFHDLETWMVPTFWYDTLAITPSTTPLTLHITGRTEGVPTDLHKNLVGRAALALAQAAAIPPTGTITLHKVLPPGGGIGGGSSDAAATLLALNHAWDLHYPTARLEQIAATLGSDIPFFIQSRPTLCTGRGEIMTPLPLAHPLYAVLIIPPIGCPTKDVYQTFDALPKNSPPPREKTDWQKCARASADQLAQLLINDLQPAAFQVAPALAHLQQQAATTLNRPVHLTGSGSTLFTLCDTASDADTFATRLTEALSLPCIPVEIMRH